MPVAAIDDHLCAEWRSQQIRRSWRKLAVVHVVGQQPIRIRIMLAVCKRIIDHHSPTQSDECADGSPNTADQFDQVRLRLRSEVALALA
jgi:hypothetical protein